MFVCTANMNNNGNNKIVKVCYARNENVLIEYYWISNLNLPIYIFTGR